MDKKKIQHYLALEKTFEEISHLNNILKITHWDFATYLPYGSAASRQKELATLSSQIHKMTTDNSVDELINHSLQEVDHLDSWQKRNLTLIQKQFNETKVIDPNLQKEYSELASQCEFKWRECRKNNDFKTLAPYLDKLFILARKISSIQADALGIKAYDVLIDKFDPDRKSSELKVIFDHTKEKLPELICKIIEKQKTDTVIPLSNPIEKRTQRNIEFRLMEVMGFDLTKGRLDESIHPFCGGTADDTRITTTYHKDNFLISSYSVIHELGHGLYQQNLPIEYRGQLVGEPKGMAFHESQSLLMEVAIGTSRPFLEFYSKLLRDEFGIKGPEYSAENLLKLKTRVIPSFIRIDADQATYPLHVLLRYEIEEKIINGDITASDLPSIWNAKMQEYLGITPKNDIEGCIQDIHWQSGLFGYFPCYYLGTLISTMLMKKIKQQYADIDHQISVGNFQEINQYLNKNLRNLGSSCLSHELLQTSTGYSEIQTDIFFEYLTDKYLR